MVAVLSPKPLPGALGIYRVRDKSILNDFVSNYRQPCAEDPSHPQEHLLQNGFP